MKSWDDLDSIERSRVMDLVNALDGLTKIDPSLTISHLLRELTLTIKQETTNKPA